MKTLRNHATAILSHRRLISSRITFDRMIESARVNSISALNDFDVRRAPPEGTALWLLTPIVCESFQLEDVRAAHAIAVSTLAIDLAARHLDAIADEGLDVVADAHIAARLVGRAMEIALVATKGNEQLAGMINGQLSRASSQERAMLVGDQNATFDVGVQKNEHLMIGAAIAAATTGAWPKYEVVRKVLGQLVGAVQIIDDLLDVEDDLAAGRQTVPIGYLANGASPSKVLGLTINSTVATLESAAAEVALLGARVSAEYLRETAMNLRTGFAASARVTEVHDLPRVVRRITPTVLQYGP